MESTTFRLVLKVVAIRSYYYQFFLSNFQIPII